MAPQDPADLLVLLLDRYGDPPDQDPVPRRFSIAGICEVLGYDHGAVADRIALLSAIDGLKDEGVLAESTRQVEGVGERTVYRLTDAGYEQAGRLRDTLLDETVLLRTGNDDRIEVPLREIDEYVDEPAIPRALAAMTDDGVLTLETEGSDEFVDRTTELERLVDAHETALDDGGIVLVNGEPGVGKTTLAVEAFEAHLDEVELLVGQCLRDSSTPYDPFRSVLEQAPGADGGFPDDRSGTAIDGPQQLQQRREALFEAVRQRLATATETTPLVIVLEDLHLASTATVDLLDYLATGIDERLLLVGTYRPAEVDGDAGFPDVRSSWEGGPLIVDIELEPFDREATRSMIEWVVDRRDIPGTFVDLIYDHTGGNALFIEESVRELLNRGAVDPDHGVYPSHGDDLPFPDGVRPVLDRKLDAFDESAQELLSIAALIGETVGIDLLAAVANADAGIDERTVSRYVEAFESGGIFERTDGGDGVRFLSGVLRERTIDRLEAPRRRTLHERIATAMEQVRSDAGEDADYHARVAYHLEGAEQYERAVDYRLEAAERATDVYAHEVALENYDQALRHLRDHLDKPESAEVDVLASIAEVKYLLGEYDAAERYFGYAAERIEDPERGRQIARKRADMQSSRGNHKREMELCRAAIDRYGVDDTPESCLIYGRLYGALLDHEGGDLDAAKDALDRCVEIADRIDDPEATAAACLNAGAHDSITGSIDEETVERLERGVEAAERSGDDRSLARALNNLSIVHSQLLSFDDARRVQKRCIEVQRRIGDEATVCDSMVNLALLEMNCGHLSDAIDVAEEALDLAQNVQYRRFVARAALVAGEAYHVAGKFDRATEQLSVGEPQVGNLELDARAYLALLRAELALDRGHFDRARMIAASVAASVEETPLAEARADAMLVIGAALHETGTHEEAIEAYRKAVEAVDETGIDHQSLRVTGSCGIARCRLATDDVDGARDALDDARSLAVDHPPLAHTRAELRRTAGAIQLADGNADAAVEELAASLRIARQAGWAIQAWETLLDLGRIDPESVDVDGVPVGDPALRTVRSEAMEAGAARILARLDDER